MQDLLKRVLLGGGGGFAPSALFAAGEAGAWYDPSDTRTMFQDTAGTTPVTAVEQPVGALLDARAPSYSNYFDGSGDYLSVPDSAAFDFGAGEFTVEAWFYRTNSVAATSAPIVAQSVSGAAVNSATYFGAGNDGIAIYLSTSGTSWTNFMISSTAPTQNAWAHIVWQRRGNTLEIYLNGVSQTVSSGSSSFSGTVFNSSRNIEVGAQAGAGSTAGYISNVRVVKGTAVYTANFTPPTSPLTAITGTSLLTCGNSWSGNPAITRNGDVRVDGLNPFVATFGNHAQAYNNTTARPILRARVNLLTYSEQFDNAAWSKANFAVVTANTDIAPDGTTTADTVSASTTGAFRSVRRTPAGLVANTQFVYSVYVKPGTTSWVNLRFWDTGPDGINAWFNVATGTVGTVQAGCIGTITSAGNGWWRCVITRTVGATIAFNEIDIGVVDGNNTYTATAGASILIWGAQLIATNAFPANTYQRIAAATDYDSVGFPYYLAFDGVDDGMSTPANLNLSGTDKATVFAGVRKLATGTLQLVELSADASVNNGVFSMPQDVSTNTWTFASKGTSLVTATSGALYAPPISTVNTGIGNISSPAATLRVNGVVVANNINTQGTGNYGSYPLYIGSRNNASLWFNGQLYSLIVRGAATAAPQLVSTEQWVAQKTGISIP